MGVRGESFTVSPRVVGEPQGVNLAHVVPDSVIPGGGPSRGRDVTVHQLLLTGRPSWRPIQCDSFLQGRWAIHWANVLGRVPVHSLPAPPKSHPRTTRTS